MTCGSCTFPAVVVSRSVAPPAYGQIVTPAAKEIAHAERNARPKGGIQRWQA